MEVAEVLEQIMRVSVGREAHQVEALEELGRGEGSVPEPAGGRPRRGVGCSEGHAQDADGELYWHHGQRVARRGHVASVHRQRTREKKQIEITEVMRPELDSPR